MKERKRIPAGSIWLCCLLTMCSGCGESSSHIPAVTNFDPVRYTGIWYAIARLPHRFERGMSNVLAEYSLRPDGRIDVVNRGVKDGEEQEIHGVARKCEGFPACVGELEVSFFGPFYGKYRIVYLKEDYSVAMITSDTMDYFWILSRTPDLPEAVCEELLRQAECWGVPTDKLEYPGKVPSPKR